MSVKLSGFDKLEARIKEIKDLKDVESAIEQSCALVERSAKQAAPKDTGELRNSIQSKVENSGDTIQGTVFTNLEYAPYVEFGTGLFAESGGRKDVPWFYVDDEGKWHITSGQKPRPYMRPALDENREQIKRIIKEALKI